MVGLNKLLFRLFMALFILAGITLLTHSIPNVTRAAMRQDNQPAFGDLVPFYLPFIQRNGTTVCGAVTTDTTWGITGNPYRVTCDVIVSTHVTLTIEAGALVQFEHLEDDLIVFGALQVTGTEVASITFQPLSGTTLGSWGRIAFMPGSSGVLDNAILEYGGSREGMVYIASDDVQVLNSVVQYSQDTGIFIHASSPLIKNNYFIHNAQGFYGGGIFNDSGSPVIQNNTFSANYGSIGGGMYNDSGDPAILDNTFSGNNGSAGGGLYNAIGNPLIQNNTFEYNHPQGGGIGGGLYNDSGNPQIQNNIFAQNSEGGLINISGNPMIQNNIFTQNGAYPGGGGGVNNNTGNPLIQNNTFTGNNANVGGGIYNDSGNPIIQNNTFINNEAHDSGGGLFNGSGNLIIRNNIFTDNWATYGGGAYNNTGSPVIQNNSFTHNSIYDVTGNGGGLYNASGNPEILKNIFSNNSGCGLFNASGNPSIQNNIFSGNFAYAGGGVYLSLGDPILMNNTFFSNTATLGGAVYILASGPILLSNLIVNNTADNGGGIFNSLDANPTLDYNNVWNNAGGDYVLVVPGAHDISADPLLVDPANADFHLASGSPCIDAGDPVNYPPTDFEGDPRPQGPAPDIGADEYRSPP